MFARSDDRRRSTPPHKRREKHRTLSWLELSTVPSTGTIARLAAEKGEVAAAAAAVALVVNEWESNCTGGRSFAKVE